MIELNKAFYVLDFLWHNTDSEHLTTTNEIIDSLAELEIKLERHKLNDIISEIEEYGIDVHKISGSPNKYYIGSRKFELSELKLLVDAVESSKFISAKKSRDLVDKIYTLTNKYQSEELERHLYVDGRVKSENKFLLKTVEILFAAIKTKKQVVFQYTDYDVDMKKMLKHNGFIYEFSPFAMLWHNDFYYVLGFSKKHNQITKFRVDRIENIEISGLKAIRKPKGFNPMYYLKSTIAMYDGEMQEIKLLCDCDMMKVIIDQFGKSISTESLENQGRFIAKVNVSVSPTFFGWLFGFAGKIRLISPPNVVDEYKTLAKAVIEDSI